MKNRIYLFAAAALTVGLSSCDPGSGTSTQNYTLSTYNLIVDSYGREEPLVVPSYYRYDFDLNTGKATITSELALSSNRSITINAEDVPFGFRYFTEKGTNNIYEVINLVGELPGKTSEGELLSDLNCELTAMVYTPPINYVSLPKLTLPANKFTIMQYNMGDKLVKTFWPDVTFRGTTTSNYVSPSTGSATTYEGYGTSYRVVMDLEKMKATVVMYYPRFAEEMPDFITNIVLKDLDLKFGYSGYEVSGTEIIPMYYEMSGEGTPFPSYKFDKFMMTSTGDMVNCDIDFSVAGKYQASFSGAYALKSSAAEKE